MKRLTSTDALIKNALMSAAFVAAERLDYTWAFRFGNGSSLTFESLWRLISEDAIVVTSEDDGQQFGLNRTINAASELTAKLVGQFVADVSVNSATSDVTISFNDGLRLEVLSTSSGFEAWSLSAAEAEVIGRNGDRVYFPKAPKK